VHTIEGIVVIAAGAVAGGLAAFPLRTRLPRPAVDALAAAFGLGLGAGGLLLQDDVGVASWIVAPVVLALLAPLHLRALFAAGGPMRT
jgi:hypothetical protein